MTDNEIVKALPFLAKYCKKEYNDIKVNEVLLGSFDLINRQKAEIEGLEAEIDKQYEIAEANVRAEIASGGTSCHWCEDKVRAEAYKEFAERLKEKNRGKTSGCVGWIDFDDIDNLLKELGGENNETKTF